MGARARDRTCPVPLRVALATVFLLVPATMPATAQAPCEGAGGVTASVAAGPVRYELLGGRASRGLEAGVEVGTRVAGFGVRGSIHRVLMSDAPADPTGARVLVTREVFRIAGIRLCGAAHAGAATTSAGSDRATSIAGGLGLLTAARLQAGGVTIAPFLGVRALGARTSGEVLGEGLSATGGSVGGEGGVAASLGRGHAALRVSTDRFDPALGATPYPRLAIRLSVGWRF